MTAVQLIIRMMKNVGVPWQSERADGFDDGIHMGDNDTVITGIANDVASDLRNDPLFEHKMDFIDKNRLVVFRFHDHWPEHHRLEPANRLGAISIEGTEGLHIIPETTLGALAREMQTKLNLCSARMVGDPGLKAERTIS